MASIPSLPSLPPHVTAHGGYSVAYVFVLHITDEPSFDDDYTPPRTLSLFKNGKLQTTNGEPHGHWQPVADNCLQLHWDDRWYSKGRFLKVHNFKRIIYTNTWQHADEGVPSSHVQYLIQVATDFPFEQPLSMASSYRFPTEVPTLGVLPPHCTPEAGYTAEFLFVVHMTHDPSFGDDCRRPLLLTMYRNGQLQTNYSPPHGYWQATSDRCIQIQWDPIWITQGRSHKTQNFKCVVFTKVWQRSDDACPSDEKQYLIPVVADVQILRVTD